MVQLTGNVGPSGPPSSLNGLTLNATGIPTTFGGAPFFNGRWIFCDAVNGSDGNNGSPDYPVQTLTTAYGLTTSGHNDVVVMVGTGGTAGTQRLSSTLTWANNATHLIGMSAPSPIGQRARIAPPTTATTNINPLMAVTASDCMFANFSFFQGIGQSSTDEQLIDLSGAQRCYFGNVDFGGMGNSVGAGRAGSWIIKLGNNTAENVFDSCTIGLETVQRSAANASVVVAGASTQRNQFYNCRFMMAASQTSPLFVDASAAGVLNGSSMTFRRCIFQNLANISGSATPAVVMTVNAAVNGTIFLDVCTTNATKWCAATAQVQVSGFALGNGFSSGVFASAANS